MIHVSDLIAHHRCPRYAWNKRNDTQPFQGFYHMETPFSRYWEQYFHIENSPSTQVGDTNEKTLALLKENETVKNARFEYKGCRTRIPILRKIADGYLAIYPHLTSYPKEHEAYVIKINQLIAASVGIPITENQIFYLNKDYVFEDELNIQECFLVTDKLCNRKNKLNKSIRDCVEALQFDLDAWIDEVENLLKQEEPPVIERSKNCTSGRRCPYYDDCFDESDEPDNSILFLTTSQKKLDAYQSGIRHIHELNLNDLDGFRLQYAQYMASKYGQFVDHWAIHSWLQHVKMPISYLDFEWDTFAIPPYKGLHPFDVICFQYSLHIERENEPLQHLDFFASKDCRRAFIESLIKDIPKEGSILVFNMEGAEKLRLQQLSEQFPEYKVELNEICSRMIDLSKPFEAGLFYDNRMRGHYSLKNVLPVFTDEYSYHQLQIKDGMDAVYAYRNYDSSTPEEKRQIRENIRNYCKMDTFAEYVVYHGLLNLDKEN